MRLSRDNMPPIGSDYLLTGLQLYNLIHTKYKYLYCWEFITSIFREPLPPHILSTYQCDTTMARNYNNEKHLAYIERNGPPCDGEFYAYTFDGIQLRKK